MLRSHFLGALIGSTFTLVLSNYTQAQTALSSQELRDRLSQARIANMLKTPEVSAKTNEAFQELQLTITKAADGCSGDVFCYLNSLEEHSPDKCGERVWDRDWNGWALCVMSCADAGFFSRTFGECS